MVIEAAGVPADVMQPLIEAVGPLFVKLGVIAGGIFGIYLILLMVRVYYEWKKVKILKDIRFDLDQVNLHNHLPCSLNQKGFFRKTGSLFCSLFRCRRKTAGKKSHQKNESQD